MGEDQTGTIDALRQLRKDLFKPVVAEFRGNVVTLPSVGPFCRGMHWRRSPRQSSS